MIAKRREHAVGNKATAELIRTVVNSGITFEKGSVVNMCLAEEQMNQEAADKRAAEIAKNLLQMGKNTLSDIAKATGLKLEEVEELASN